MDTETTVSIHLYRIVQEMLGNTLKHAKARSISIDLAGESGNLLISVKDDGVGFDPRVATSGFGRPGLLQHPDLLDASLELVTAPDEESHGIVTLPPD